MIQPSGPSTAARSPAGSPAGASDLRDHLVTAGLAGTVQTTPGHVLANCDKMLAGDPEYTFGLSDWRDTDRGEVLAAVRDQFGPAATEGDPAGPGWIDPEATLGGVRWHAARLAARVAAGPGRALLATGHPTGLLLHYSDLARALSHAGWEILMPLDDTVVLDTGRGPRGVRFLGGVACPWSGGDLLHTHRADLMEAMLDHLRAGGGLPDLVVGDHGMAGAAVERGIETLSIADVNDPALPLAAARGRTRGVLPVDDNLAPRLFAPVTAAVLVGLPRAS